MKPTIRSLLAVVLSICCLTQARPLSAQGRAAFQTGGTVLDTNREPVAGAFVLESGTSNGATTDKNGRFTLEVRSADAEITVTMMGYESQTVVVGGRKTIKIVLEPDYEQLDHSVVIGYDVVKKSDLTGSVSSVGEDAFSNRLVTSFEDALRGKVAGVRIISSDGQPGQTLNIRIRGTGSINASNAPLYVIDGIPVDSPDISPGDVKSVEILKDASATAIYGSRGANGVVLITTRQGIKGKTRVTASANITVQQPVRLLEMMNSSEYADMRFWQVQALNLFKAGTSMTFRPTHNYYQDREGNIYGFPKTNIWLDEKYHSEDATNTDWQKAMLQNALVHDYRINVSGGDEKSTFSVMGNYFQQDGIVINSGYQKGSVRANYDRTLSEFATMGLNVSGSRAYQNGNAYGETSGVTMNMLSQPPVKELSSEDFEAVQGENEYENNNPFYQAKNIVKDIYRDNASLRLYFDIRFLKNFRYRVTGNYVFNNSITEIFYPKTVAQGRSEDGRAQYNTATTNNWMQENLLYYTPKLGKGHRFDALAGLIFEERITRSGNTESQNFESGNLGANRIQEGTVLANISNGFSRTRMVSYMARVNYSYRNRYLLTALFRADGSSCFGQDNKWGYFPSVAVAWNISEEPFMKNVNFISNLKLRASAGVSGNTAIPALRSLSGMSEAFYPMDGQTPSYGIKTARMENKNLKWETSNMYNAAIEIGLFNNRVNATAEVYYKRTSDLLFEVSVPYSLGYKKQWDNVGIIDNKGLEISADALIINSLRFSWSADFNIALNRSKVVDMGEEGRMILNPGIHASLTNFGLLEEGKPIGNWYGYRTDGLWRSTSEIDAMPDGFTQFSETKSTLWPGYTKFVDQNGDNKINEDDRRVIGSAEPKFTGGLGMTFRYLDLSLNIGLEFAYDYDIFNATRKYLEEGRGYTNQSKRYADFWRPDLYDLTTGELVMKGNESSNIRRPGAPMEMMCLDTQIEDGSYLRINNITLSYSLPRHLISKIKLHKLDIFFTVNNAFVFTKYTGYDPDVSVAKGIYSDLMPRLDYGSYPRSRGYTLGINIGI